MQVESFMLCDAATIGGGKLNVLGAFDTLYTPKVPTTHPSCAVALRMRFDHAEVGAHKFKLKVVDTDGKQIANFPERTIEVKIPDGGSFAVTNQIVNFMGLTFKDYGNYSIDLTLDNRHEASLPLSVTQIPKMKPPTEVDA